MIILLLQRNQTSVDLSEVNDLLDDCLAAMSHYTGKLVFLSVLSFFIKYFLDTNIQCYT